MSLQDFFQESFENVEEIEEKLMFGGKERTFRFRPISADKGEEIRKSSRSISIKKGKRQINFDQDGYMERLIIETTVHPNFKNEELQKNWNVLGATDLLRAMKQKMLDGEYTKLIEIVNEVNGYNQSAEFEVEEIKN